MSYFYKLGSISHEESDEITYVSDIKMTKKEFKKCVFNAIKDMLKAEAFEEKIYYAQHITVGLEKYLEKYNLKRLKYEQKLFFWGWNSEDHIWKIESSADDKKLHNLLFGKEAWDISLKDPDWKFKEEIENEKKKKMKKRIIKKIFLEAFRKTRLKPREAQGKGGRKSEQTT